MARCRAPRSPALTTKPGRGVEAGKGMGCAPGVGDGGAGAQANAGELLDQDREHRGLAAVKMISACGIDDDPVRRIGRDDRGEALQHPEREPLQRLGVRGRVGVLDHQALHQRLGLGRGHADAQAGGLGGRVRRQHHPPPPIPADQDRAASQAEARCRPPSA